MSSTLTPQASYSGLNVQPEWGEIGERLVMAFPQYPASDVIAELVNAHDAAMYVGTAEDDLPDVVEFMVTYAMKVRAGLISPSERLDPQTHSASRRRDK